MRGPILICLVVALAAPGLARADDAEQAARKDLDREMQALVHIPKPRLEIYVDENPDPNVTLTEVKVILDGRTKSDGPPPKEVFAVNPKPRRVWAGAVSRGRHKVRVLETWGGRASYGRRFAVTLEGGARLDASPGLAIEVHVRLHEKPGETDWHHRYRLAVAARPRMLAKVDASMPPPAPKPHLAFLDGGTPDAGAKKVVAAEHDGGTVRVALAAPPLPALAPIARRRRHRRRRRRVNLSRAATAPKDLQQPPLQPIVIPAAPKAATPAAGTKAGDATAPAAPPAPVPPKAEAARKASRVAYLLGGAGLLFLVAGVLFFVRLR